jgi:hypothetical protein
LGEVQIWSIKIVAGIRLAEKPHKVTWKRFLDKALKASELEAVFGGFLRSLSETEKELLNLDGKVLCSTSRIVGLDEKLLEYRKRLALSSRCDLQGRSGAKKVRQQRTNHGGLK